MFRRLISLEEWRRRFVDTTASSKVRREFIDWTAAKRQRAQVLLSTCHDVHRNLALEDWLYHKVDWSLRPPLLLLWRNSPCVVIGRHQNPWQECRMSLMNEHGVLLARRNSGGGTVFHDLGNLNCTFFTSRSNYDREDNLRLVCRALQSLDPTLDVRVSPRHDILLDDKYKISGTASKLGSSGAYHHCTVLFDVKTSLLSLVLRSDDIRGVKSKSTRSITSIVKNLQGVCFEHLVDAICTQYTMAHEVERYSHVSIDLEERQFPGLNEIVEHYGSWDWIFGKCPAFVVEREIDLPTELASPALNRRVALTMSVKRGTVDEVHVEPDCWFGKCSRDVLNEMIGTRFPTTLLLTTPEATDNSETIFLRLVTNAVFADFL